MVGAHEALGGGLLVSSGTSGRPQDDARKLKGACRTSELGPRSARVPSSAREAAQGRVASTAARGSLELALRLQPLQRRSGLGSLAYTLREHFPLQFLMGWKVTGYSECLLQNRTIKPGLPQASLHNVRVSMRCLQCALNQQQ